MKGLTAILERINGVLGGKILPLLLLAVGLYFLLRLFPCLFQQKKKGAKRAGGGRGAFRAMTMALAGTLGVGNISGVALAIALGGAGAVFWMWVSAFAAMALKYAEIVLAMAHRKSCGGEMRGGAMYYIEDTVGGRRGRFFGRLFSVLCVLTAFAMGSMMQANAAAETLSGLFSVPTAVTGAVFAVLTAAVVLGGAKKISALTVRIIPVLTVAYILVSLWVVVCNIGQMPGVLARIFRDAFSLEAAGGGVLGSVFSKGMRYGVTRGLLSNEAGCGTAPMAHATSESETPARQGMYGVFEVFLDTVVLCTLTAFVILLGFEDVPVCSGVILAVAAYGQTVGSFAAYFIAGALVVFAWATCVCWAYYCESGLAAFTQRRGGIRILRILYCLSLFPGAIFASEVVWGMTDLLLGGMCVLNVVVLFLARGEVLRLSCPVDGGRLYVASEEKKKGRLFGVPRRQMFVGERKAGGQTPPSTRSRGE